MNVGAIGPGARAPEVVNAVIEIPRGGSNKVEYDADADAFVLNRVLFAPLYYPCEYGWIVGSLSGDGDPTDILVLSTFPTFPGCVLPARIVGALRTTDENGIDIKVMAACDVDPRQEEIRDLNDVPSHIRQEIVQFFKTYKQLENKAVEVEGWLAREEALQIVQECLEQGRRAGRPGSQAA